MMARALFAVFFALLAVPAWAQVQQQFDLNPAASNAVLPAARGNLGAWPPINAAKDLGFVGDGVADNSSKLTTLFAETGSPTVYFPSGTYMIGCPTTTQTAASAISIVGDGPGSTTLKLSASCALSADLFKWINQDNVSIRNLTIDLNGATATTLRNILFFNSGSHPTLDNIRVVNGNDNMLLVSVVSGIGADVETPVVENSYFSLAKSGTLDNECIALSNPSGSGTLNHAIIQNNVCVNTGMQIDGSNAVVSGNDISGYAFGGCVYQVKIANDPKSTGAVFAWNKCHDSATTLDSNDVPQCGIEMDGNYGIAHNNQFWNLGGPGIVDFGEYNQIADNMIWNNGRVVSPRGPWDQSGIRLPSLNGEAYGSYSLITGNYVFDNGTGSQLYGYYEESPSGTTTGIRLRDNSLSGVTAAYVLSNTAGTTVNDFGWNSVYESDLSPPATTSTSNVMVGAAVSFTPAQTGRERIIVTGNGRSSAAGDGCVVQIRYGIGTAPANGAAQIGNSAGSGQTIISASNSQMTALVQDTTLTGLTIGTTYWLDLAYRAYVGGSCTLSSLDFNVVEF